jgi:hypothetical protein
MAWNPSKEVKIARDAAAKLDADMLILFAYFLDETGKSISYGKTKALCDEAREIMDVMLKTEDNLREADDLLIECAGLLPVNESTAGTLEKIRAYWKKRGDQGGQ